MLPVGWLGRFHSGIKVAISRQRLAVSRQPSAVSHKLRITQALMAYGYLAKAYAWSGAIQNGWKP